MLDLTRDNVGICYADKDRCIRLSKTERNVRNELKMLL